MDFSSLSWETAHILLISPTGGKEHQQVKGWKVQVAGKEEQSSSIPQTRPLYSSICSNLNGKLPQMLQPLRKRDLC